MSFRRKIVFSYIVIFFFVVLCAYPVLISLIQNTQKTNLISRTEALIKSSEEAPTLRMLIARLNQKAPYLFFRVSLISPSEGNLYDSHQAIGGQEFREENLLAQPEVEEALKIGNGTSIRYSPIFGEEMAFVAVRFDFQGQPLVMRTAFPYGEVDTLAHDFTFSILFYLIGVLLLFGLLAWLIFHLLTRPAQQIIAAIRPYQLGQTQKFPEIHLGKGVSPDDDFGRLAGTLNELSRKIEHQIETLIYERNDKIAILESLGEGVVAVDQTMQVHYFNRMAETFLGISKKAILGRPFSEAKQEACLDLLKQAQKVGELCQGVIQPEGKPRRTLDVIAVPRGPKGALLVLQDKTRLHKVIELGRDFIANASHELKTPITIIRGFAETLHDHPELSREVSGEITEKIVANCRRMDTLVKNLLTLAAVDEGLPRSRLHECDLIDLAQQARQTVLTVHPHAQITIETQGKGPFHLLADGDLMLQAILNLLDNAAKYSEPPAQITVTVEKLAHEITLKLQDQGIGIPQEDLDRIFERFYAVDKSHSRSLGGSGLGLSIVERIVEKHGGKISVESRPDKGTTFTLILPLRDD